MGANENDRQYNDWMQQCSSMRAKSNTPGYQISLPERLKRAEESALEINSANQQLLQKIRNEAEQQRKKIQAAREEDRTRLESKPNSPQPSPQPPTADPPATGKPNADSHCFPDLDTCMRSANTPGSCYFMYRKYEVTNTRLSSSLQTALQNCRTQCSNSRTSAGYCNSLSDFENLSLACDAEDRAATGCALH
jgi:hypothetical protein